MTRSSINGRFVASYVKGWGFKSPLRQAVSSTSLCSHVKQNIIVGGSRLPPNQPKASSGVHKGQITGWSKNKSESVLNSIYAHKNSLDFDSRDDGIAVRLPQAIVVKTHSESFPSFFDSYAFLYPQVLQCKHISTGVKIKEINGARERRLVTS